MRTSDINVFSRVAKGKFWILVRITNKHSLPYIGQPDYGPKEMDCKAKTADKDVEHFELKGLVTSPKIHPGAFNPDKLIEAKKEWEKTDINDGQERVLSSRYVVNLNKKSNHYGCLMLKGKYIHGDYDLFDIIDITQPQRNLALHLNEDGRVHRVGANFREVQAAVNAAIGINMVQHGADAQFRHFDDVDDKPIDAFGPGGEYVTILNKYSLHFWYKDRFEGRQFIGEKKMTPAN